MTMAGMVLGTPQYMPPEQARGETDHFDARTDIYSLGALLYHILTLEPPIQGEDVQQMLQSVVDGKVAPQVASHGPRRVESSRALSHIPGGKIPEVLAEVTRKAMALRQEDRFQTVKELQSAVQGYQSGSTARRPEPASARPPGKINALVIGLLVIIALLAGACVKLAMDRSAGEAALRGKP
jgi:eukaryotic-like serine/threonine-protein kinase